MNLKALHKISYGMYVVTTRMGERINGQIANAVMQTTSEPATVAVCLNKKNLTHEFILASRIFTISVLSTEASMALIGNFGYKSGRDADKFDGINYHNGTMGAPIVTDNAIAYIECELLDHFDAGTHTIFLGKVVDADILADGEPMTYAFYHIVKGGISPKNAPTYIKPDDDLEKTTEAKMRRYQCTVCGYIYDPAKGDPIWNIEPGTPFDELPYNWVCPICGADKSAFKPVE